DADGDARASRHLVAQVLQAIGEDHRGLVARVPVRDVDQRTELLLLHHLVHFGERDLGRDDLVEQDTSDRRIDEPGRAARLRGYAHLDLGLQVDLALIVGDANLGEARERLALAFRGQALARYEVEPE